MKEAIKVLAPQNDEDDADDKRLKIGVETLRYALGHWGEKMADHEIDEIMLDCVDLIYDDYILIDDFANYLMNR